MPAVASAPRARAQPVTRRHGPSGRRLLAPLLGLIGLALAYAGADELVRVLPTRGWPTVPGQVTAARVTEDRVGTYVGKYRNGTLTAPRFHVDYAYRVGARAYRGQRVALTSLARRDAWADQRRYPRGTAVTVHYDPAQPERAVLEVPWPFRALASTVIGLLALGLAWRLHRRAGTTG